MKQMLHSLEIGLAISALTLSSCYACSQSLDPSIEQYLLKKHQPILSKTDIAIDSACLGMSVLDAYSTHQMIDHGSKELFLPNALAHSNAGMYAFGVGVTALQVGAQIELRKHHHEKLATTLGIIRLGSLSYYPWHNLTLHQSR